MLELEGTLNRVVFAREEFAIARVELASGETVTVLGPVGGLRPGERLRLEGDWETHSRFGAQFRVVAATAIVPATVEGIERYLGSGLIAGIGAGLAHRIVAHFGDQTLEILEKDPKRLTEVGGLGKKRRAQIAQAIGEKKWLRDALVFLEGHGLGPGMAHRVVRRFGADTTTIVQRNPYCLAEEVAGVGFLTADRIARSLGIAADAPERRQAALLHALQEAEGKGHVYLPRPDVCARAAELTSLDVDHFESQVTALTQRGHAVLDGDSLYLPVLHAAELAVAERLRELVRTARPMQIAVRDAERLSVQQRQAVRAALSGGVVVVTGGPGTGKTTLVNALVSSVKAANRRVLLAAPTGRAAKRLSEATDSEAMTLHRLLEFDGKSFAKGATSPLKADFVVVDEVSMVDISLARSLLLATRNGTSLVLVGDADQLPSVGPGTFLADVIASGAVAVVRLTEVFRQAAQSGIVRAAHRIREGSMPELTGEDVFLVKTDDATIARQRAVEACVDRIPKRFGLDPSRDVQVIAPMHRGEAGVSALNAALREQLGGKEGPSVQFGDRTFRVGDKVMQLRNDYDKDVFNGDVGFVTAIDDEEEVVTLEVDGRSVLYEADELGDLEHAWAVTVHKSQGGESPAVVLVLTMQSYPLLQRNLLYTAVTRARQLLIVVGSARALGRAVSNATATRRFSRLKERLSAAAGSAYVVGDAHETR